MQSTSKISHCKSDKLVKLLSPPQAKIPILNTCDNGTNNNVDVNLPLSLVQLSPIITSEEKPTHCENQLSSPESKLHILEIFSERGLNIKWDVEVEAANKEQPTETRLIVSSGTLYYSSQERDQATAILSQENNDNSKFVLMPIVSVPSQDPLDIDGVACLVRGYSVPYCKLGQGPFGNNSTYESPESNHPNPNSFEITDGTLIQILPAVTVQWIDREKNMYRVPIKHHPMRTEELGTEYTYPCPSCTQHNDDRYDFIHETSLLSEANGTLSVHTKYEDGDFLLSYEEETVRALTIRMKMLMDRQIMVGTTHDAVDCWQEACTRQKRMKEAFASFLSRNSDESDLMYEENMGSMSLINKEEKIALECRQNLQDGALTVHDPTHGSGKTTLMATIARTKLKCNAVHVINASTLFAQYGASGADAGLESLLHGIIISAAAKNMNSYCEDGIGSICIILDNLETFAPPGMSGGRDTGDPAVPALNAIRAYLTRVVNMVRTTNAFPYPTKNPLYNVKGKNGVVIPVKILLIGIVTCDDDGGRKAAGQQFNSGTVLDILGENRYRLPSPSMKGGIEICERLFKKQQLKLSPGAMEELPFLVSSMQKMIGSSFQTIVANLKARIQEKVGREGGVVCVDSFDLTMAFLRDRNSSVSIYMPRKKEATKDNGAQSTSASTEDALFSSIGGNDEAKKALLDALAIDERKKLILSRFGLAPPTGVLLYGPPGCGKTLLAKATAHTMQRDPRDNRAGKGLGALGGLFISLSASDIVRSEVGKSEKLVSHAFETARDNAPSVIFIDEFQALFTSRDGDNGGTKSSGRLASTLLQCMDDVSKWRDADNAVSKTTFEQKFESDRVVVLGATNTPWMVDRAFLRSGRFDRVVHVGLPNERERQSILQVHVQRMKLHTDTNSDDVCKKMAADTLGFSGADIAALVRSAAVRCLNESSSNFKDTDVDADVDTSGVEMRHFTDARLHDLTEPSSNNALVTKLLHWKP